MNRSKKLMLSLSLPLTVCLTLTGATFAAGCASQQHLTKGEIAYNGGDFPTAKTELEAADVDKREYSGQQLERLALYRGLTALALGDRVTAGRYLAEAKVREAKDPGTLTADENAKMEQALHSLLTDAPH